MWIHGHQLCEVVKQYKILGQEDASITPPQLRYSGIALTLYRKIEVERNTNGVRVINAANPVMLRDKLDIDNKAYLLGPGKLITVRTNEIINLPDHIHGGFTLSVHLAEAGIVYAVNHDIYYGHTGEVKLRLFNSSTNHMVEFTPNMLLGKIALYEETE